MSGPRTRGGLRPSTAGGLTGVVVGVEPSPGRRDSLFRVHVPLLPSGNAQRVTGHSMSPREGPHIDDVIAGDAQGVAHEVEVRYVGEEAGCHLGDPRSTLPRFAPIDDDPPIGCVEL